MSKAIYLKQEEEVCNCMIEIPDGTECEIHPFKGKNGTMLHDTELNKNDFVSVKGCERGCWLCPVYYRTKNFMKVGKQDETEMERDYNFEKETV